MTLQELEAVKAENFRTLADLRSSYNQLSNAGATSNFCHVDWSTARPYTSTGADGTGAPVNITTTGTPWQQTHEGYIGDPEPWQQQWNQPNTIPNEPMYPGGTYPLYPQVQPYSPWNPLGGTPFSPFNPPVSPASEPVDLSDVLRRMREQEELRRAQDQVAREVIDDVLRADEIADLKKRLKHLEDQIKAAEDKQKEVDKQIEETKEKERRITLDL